jgi:aminopeptidase N
LFIFKNGFIRYLINMRYFKILSLFLLFCGVGCSHSTDLSVQKGVSKVLAESRRANLMNVSYGIHLKIPSAISAPILGKEFIHFDYTGGKEPLQVDFAVNSKFVKRVLCNGKELDCKIVSEHLLIPSKYLKKNRNEVFVEFVVADKSLNRNSEYLYSLFVPDKARTVFPCFDQPDIKANFNLILDVPNDWTAVSCASVKLVKKTKRSNVFYFQKSDLVSTYQFAFVAGKFSKIEKQVDGRMYCIYHREKDPEKVRRNADPIFKEVSHAVRWMETYTGISFPFSKYDLIILPSFQFSGMEHVGAVYYLDSKMWLNENATQQEKLGRTELIGHETAHLWFGDMVTMKWFDDVWMKEVFAGFFADKIVESLYPAVNHQLQFLVSHAPKAYSEDRTLGNNPIRQNLENLNEAGSLYGNIVYHKSPIVIRSLERLMGKEKFQTSLREYLRKYEHSNASWLDLVQILGKHSAFSIEDWSRTWIESARMPVYKFDYELVDQVVSQFYVKQICEANKGLCFFQQLKIEAQGANRVEDSILLKDLNGEMLGFKGLKNVPAFIPNSDGMAYGAFLYDESSLEWLLNNFYKIEDPLVRGSALINIYENMVKGKIDGDKIGDLLCQVIVKENNEQILGLALDYLTSTLLFYSKETSTVEKVEDALWFGFSSSSDKKIKIQYLRAFSKLMKSSKSSKKLLDLWSVETAKEASWISENDLNNFALELAIRFPKDWETIIGKARKRIKGSDVLLRFNFIANAVNSSEVDRDKFFASLLNFSNRKNEPWVIDALKYLNHPLREKESEKYLMKGLEILPEIQRTGDIFFPKSWLTSLLYGHKSKEAYAIVQKYKNGEGKKIAPTLMLKLLQASDNLRRANTISK